MSDDPKKYWLSGGGTVTGVFAGQALPDVKGVGTFREALYLAAPAAAVTPEPASLLLLGTGVAALWSRRRFSRS